MKGKLTFLGTGGSMGVPVLGCLCEVCQSHDRLNQRLRPSVLIQIECQLFLIDPGPDFRLQALKNGITKLNGLLLTHAHHDHTAGMDDLRPICYRRQDPLPILLSSETAQDLQTRYSYLFQSKTEHSHSQFALKLLPDQAGIVNFENIPIQYVSYMQGEMLVNGYRIGDFAYLSDIRHFSRSIFKHLQGVRYLVISALRYTLSTVHFSVDEAIDFARTLKAQKVWLTHISHDLEHHQTNRYLPNHMSLAYDGLEIDLTEVLW